MLKVENDPMLKAFFETNGSEEKVVEEPKVEEVVETPKAEEVEQPVVEQVEQPKVETQTFDDKQILKEKLGFESWEEVQDKLKGPKFKDEYSETLYRAIAEGKDEDVYKYLEAKFFDANKLSEVDRVTKYLKETKPYMSDDDIKDMLWDEFSLGKLPLTEEEKNELTDAEIKAYEKELKSGNRKFKDLTSEATQYLNSQKKDYELPKYEAPKVDEGKLSYDEWAAKYNAEIEAEEAEQAQIVEQINKNFKEDLSNFDRSIEFTINLGDTENRDDFQFKYQVSDKDLEEIGNKLQDLLSQKYWDKYATGEGKEIRVDFKKAAKDLLFNELTQKILKSGVKEATAREREDLIKNKLKNVSRNVAPSGPSNQSSAYDDAIALMRLGSKY